MESTLKYAEHKLDEAIKQGETDVDIAYWRGYRDCVKVTTKDHFRDSAKMVPLTLEQLRGMDGQPVFMQMIGEPKTGRWVIVDYADTENPDKTLYTKEGITYSDYGKHFVAYAYPPAHIDREAFGCEFCNAENHCANCLYDNLPGQMEPCRSCEAHSNWETAHRFCPHCGKPMTEEAWAELEKRMSGVM